MPAVFTPTAARPVRLRFVTVAGWESADLPGLLRRFAEAQGFRGGAGQTVLMPDPDGALGDVLAGLGDGRDTLAVAALSARLPEGDYALEQAPEDWPLSRIAAGWADGAYRFDRYLREPARPPRLVIGEGAVADAMTREAAACELLRNLVNTPAEDLGPADLQAVMSDQAERHGARLEAIVGDALLEANYPLVHAVGRGALRAPRMLELTWGDPGAPKLALVGKGVVFDTGGLNVKVNTYMRLMKKDMGGAAHAIALGGLVMDEGLPVHLSLYVPAVENSISASSFRPGDILESRKGLTVEIDNTDAEGRLVLGDALARACEREPQVLIDFATLTGAARVALGPDLAPYFTEDNELAIALERGAIASGDPVWRLPLWPPYLEQMRSPIADLVNAGGPMAGALTAAIFLKQFVSVPAWVHFDIWAWREGKYGRPAGGAPTGLRAAWAMLKARYG